jgi:hypothetical protein
MRPLFGLVFWLTIVDHVPLACLTQDKPGATSGVNCVFISLAALIR